jgi:hypothetical protein
MLLSLAGWRRVPIENGMQLQPPDGVLGLIQIRHRQPLRMLTDIREHFERTTIGGAPTRPLDAPRAITTDEGEYGALLSFVTTSGPERRRNVGVVWGDEWMSTIDARCASAQHFELFAAIVEHLLVSLALGLGTDRFRRYFYTPPTNWSGLQRFRCDAWLAPGFPINDGIISVFHARPEGESRPRMQHHRLFEELTSEYGARRGEAQPIHTRSGMVGEVATYATAIGPDERHAGNVVFSDGRHHYLLRIETSALHRAANTEAFLRVVDSVEALPWPRSDLAGLVHWSD